MHENSLKELRTKTSDCEKTNFLHLFDMKTVKNNTKKIY